MFDILSYHRKQFQGKRVAKTQKNGEKPRFGPDYPLWVHIHTAKTFFQKFGFISH